jgi:hypothetical protein
MGVLDDAIREHLELKRKHGLSEEELRRQEEEALGPVRREVAPPEEAEAWGDGEPEAEREVVAPFDGETRAEEAEPDADEPGPEPFAEDAASAAVYPAPPSEPVEPLSEPEEQEGLAEPEPDWLESQLEPSMDHSPEGSRRFEREAEVDDGGPDGDGPAAEEDSRGADDFEDDPEERGDVLEDTPDFLEETPEHDRLWFEQKPPRDFDFD